jgi:protein O-GlcNAc transferase
MKVNINYSNRIIPIEIYANEHISNIIKNTNSFYEIKFLQYVSQNHNKHGTIIDIGANIGNHSLFFSEFLEYDKICCFEPFPQNASLCRTNLINKNCEIYEIALSNEDGEATLYNSERGNYGGFSLVDYGSGMSFKVLDSVQTRTLDSYDINNVSMIKLDAENHELQILQGAKKTIIKNKPIIFLEDVSAVHPHLFARDRYDKYFADIGYIKKHINIHNYVDLWVPKK